MTNITNESSEIEKIKFILKKYIIQTEKAFSVKYLKEFNKKMAQSTAHRKFKHYGVVKDPAKERYVYVGRQLREPATEEDKLHNLLSCYCDGIIYKDDERMELWISVDAEAEKLIATKMTEFFFLTNSKLGLSDSKPVSILIGASCLFIKVFPLKTEKQVEAEKQNEEKKEEKDRRRDLYIKIIELIESANKRK